MKRYVVLVSMQVDAEDQEDAEKAVMALLDDPEDVHWQIDSTIIQSAWEIEGGDD